MLPNKRQITLFSCLLIILCILRMNRVLASSKGYRCLQESNIFNIFGFKNAVWYDYLHTTLMSSSKTLLKKT